MDTNSGNDLTATAATSELETSLLLGSHTDFQSLRNEPDNPPESRLVTGYEDVDWSLLKGYVVPQDDFRRRSGIYNYGWRLWHPKSNEYYWLCRACHRKKRNAKGGLKPVIFKATKSSSSSSLTHLKETHNINQFGQTIKTTRKGPLDDWTKCRSSEVEAIYNERAASFDPFHFQALLFNWLISDNVLFRQLESQAFCDLMTYTNPQAKLPGRTNASRTVARIHDKSIANVTEALATSISRINLSFDLWTSGNKLALLGICSHFIDKNGKPITSLLALPRQKGRHSGLNMAETIADIIAAYGPEDKLGYFTTDNASSNETCLDALAQEYGFTRDKRWIRCCGHIFNLVGQAALFGCSQQLFSDDAEGVEDAEHELKLWRRRGPIGKLHNVITWINRSPQRVERFIKLQLQLMKPNKPDDKKDSYQLITDVTTRWNSFYDSASRAVYVRLAIDSLLEEEVCEYDRYTRHLQLRNPSAKPKDHTILADRLTPSDWTVISQYLEILKPLKDATLQLEGHIGGRFGSIWQVLPVFEQLLSHFEAQATRYPVNSSLRMPDLEEGPPLGFTQQPSIEITSQLDALPDAQLTAEDHFSINIDLAWKKLDQYYVRLDNTPVYVAAVVLHPCHKWRWLERKWIERRDWLLNARSAFGTLLEDHRNYEPTEDEHPPRPQKRPRIDVMDSDDEPEEADIDSQMTDYLRDIHYRGLCADKTTSPIDYWLSKRLMWPQLSALALDLYSIAVMSDEPERVFSTTGAAVTPRRRSLLDSTINHLMVVKQWLKTGLITLDRAYFTTLHSSPTSPPSSSGGTPSYAGLSEVDLVE